MIKDRIRNQLETEGKEGQGLLGKKGLIRVPDFRGREECPG